MDADEREELISTWRRYASEARASGFGFGVIAVLACAGGVYLVLHAVEARSRHQ